MKKEGRAVLLCRKKLIGKVDDHFRVVVKSGNKETAKAEYQRQGYHVEVI